MKRQTAWREVERLRSILQLMDDRKYPMMPRAQMAKLAKTALGVKE